MSELPPSHRPLPAPNSPELTLRVVVLGILLSVVMGAANVYVGLKAGMTVSASIPAAVMAMLVFRLLRGGTILEANQVQTCASAGESLAAGIIFTMPALLLAGYWKEFDFWTVTLVAMTGGLLGILFMIPMRKVFVVDNDELPYPEGIACAAVLEAGTSEEQSESEAKGAVAMLWGGLMGALFKIGADFLHLIQGSAGVATSSGARIHYFGSSLSPMLVAVGVIVRLNVAALIFIGGAISWLVILPFMDGSTYLSPPDGPASAMDAAWGLWSREIRYIGVGAMVLGGLSSILTVRKGLVSAVTELRRRMGSGATASDDPRDRDLPGGVLIGLALLCIALIAFVYWRFTQDGGVTAITTVAMIVLAFFMTAVASYIVGLVGNSNSPVSGMTITAVLVTGVLLWALGYREGMGTMVAIVGVAAIVCCVACTSGDVCNDLKTGSLVGASPYRQQIMQIVGVVVAAFVMAPILTVLHHGTDGGIGGPNLNAPQAALIKSLAEGFSGQGELPWHLIGIGAGVGAVILLADAVLKARGSSFRMYLMPIAVGMYLPFELAPPILLGGLIAHLALRGSRGGEDSERRMHRGVLFGSGVIAGESLMAVALAILKVAEVEEPDLGLSGNVVSVLTWTAVFLAGLMFLRTTLAGAREASEVRG